SWQDNHPSIYHVDKAKQIVRVDLADGSTKDVPLPFDWEKYGYGLTRYGVLFWQVDPEEKEVVNEGFGTIPYYTAPHPDFRFFDGQALTFVTLPEVTLPETATTYEAPAGVHDSSSERKLIIAIGRFDIESPEFEPGLVDSQPVSAYGLIYNIDTNRFESGDPLSTYLKILDISTTLFRGMSWDSEKQRAVSVPGGEGCGPYSTLTFVNLQAGTAQTVGGDGSFDFSSDIFCNPSNRESPDGKWFILSGINTSGQGSVYLFDVTGVELKHKTVEMQEDEKFFRSDKWDLSGAYPRILFSEGAIVDFND
ncbi:MAG: hypothetical protein AAB448_04545, partial [Patescibacteria group bacterium]